MTALLHCLPLPHCGMHCLSPGTLHGTRLHGQKSQNKTLFSDIVIGAFRCDKGRKQMHSLVGSLHCLKPTNLHNVTYTSRLHAFVATPRNQLPKPKAPVGDAD